MVRSETPEPTGLTLDKLPQAKRLTAVFTLAAASAFRPLNQWANGLLPEASKYSRDSGMLYGNIYGTNVKRFRGLVWTGV